MNQGNNTQNLASYMIWRHNSLVAGGVVEITDNGPDSWTEVIYPIASDRLSEFYASYDGVKDKWIVFNLKDVPGIDLIMPKNTELMVRQACEAIRHIDMRCRPAEFPVKPNPTKS